MAKLLRGSCILFGRRNYFHKWKFRNLPSLMTIFISHSQTQQNTQNIHDMNEKIAMSYKQKDIDGAIKYSEELIDKYDNNNSDINDNNECEQHQTDEILKIVYYNLSKEYYSLNKTNDENIEKAKLYLQKSLDITKKQMQNNEEYEYNDNLLSDIYLHFGDLYSNKDISDKHKDIPKALQYYEKRVEYRANDELQKAIKEELLYVLFSKYCYTLKQYEKSIKYGLQLINLDSLIHFTKDEINTSIWEVRMQLLEQYKDKLNMGDRAVFCTYNSKSNEFSPNKFIKIIGNDIVNVALQMYAQNVDSEHNLKSIYEILSGYTLLNDANNAKSWCEKGLEIDPSHIQFNNMWYSFQIDRREKGDQSLIPDGVYKITCTSDNYKQIETFDNNGNCVIIDDNMIEGQIYFGNGFKQEAMKCLQNVIDFEQDQRTDEELLVCYYICAINCNGFPAALFGNGTTQDVAMIMEYCEKALQCDTFIGREWEKFQLLIPVAGYYKEFENEFDKSLELYKKALLKLDNYILTDDSSICNVSDAQKQACNKSKQYILGLIKECYDNL